MKLIKRLVFILIALVLLTVVGLYIFIATFDVNKYKPEIIAQAEKAIGRKVDFKEITLGMSLSQGIRAAVHDFSIGENPAYGSGDFVKVGEVFVGVDVMAYVTKKEVSLTAVTVKSPAITIIKGADGQMNVSTIGKKQPKAEPAPAEAAPKAAAALPAVMVGALDIEDGIVTFIDRTQSPELKASINDVDFSVDGFSLTDTFDISLKLAAFAKQQNINIGGKVKLDLLKQGAAISDFAAALDLSATDVAQLKALPNMKTLPQPEVLKGKLTATIAQLAVDKNGLGNIALDTKLEGGVVKIANVAPGVSLDIPAIDLVIKDFAPGKAGTFDMKLAYLHDTPNIFSTGSITFDQQSKAVQISNGTLTTDLSTLSFDKLKASVASLKDAKLPQDLKGALAINGLTVRAGSGAPAAYAGTLTLKDGVAKVDALPAPLSAINATLGFTQADLDIQSLAAKLGEGSIGAKGKVLDYTGAKQFSVGLTAENVAIDSLLDQSKAQEKAQGNINLTATASGSAAQLNQTLNGKGNLELLNGKLVNVNVLARVLEKITSVPGLQQALKNNMPRVWQQKLQKPDTDISKLAASADIRNGTATITPIDVQAEGFAFGGTGQYTLSSKQYGLIGDFIIPKDTATEMASGVKELEYLMNKQKEVRFPLKVQGAVGGKANFSPDVKYVLQNAIENKGKDQLMRVIDKKLQKSGKGEAADTLRGLLGVPKSQQQPQSQQQQAPEEQAPASQQQQQQQQQPTLEQQLLDGALKGLMR